MKIVIIGAGWNGIHTALELAKKGHQVTIFEGNPEILRGLSGTFGVRIHIGPHYPLSQATRKACQSDYARFVECYKDIVVEHDKSYYALASEDAQGKPPRVDDHTFGDVCREFQFSETVDLNCQTEFSKVNLTSLHSVHEPSALVGQPLRDKLLQRLQRANITLRCSAKVTNVTKHQNKFIVIVNGAEVVGEGFDHVINTTAFQSLTPKEPLPFNMSVVSQICAVTLVQDLQPKSDKPFSFTVMDGRNPCIMPYLDGTPNQYIIYHSLYTILATSHSYQDSWDYIKTNVNEQFLYDNVVIPSMDDLTRFIPGAKQRFKIVNTKMGIIQKVDTNCEYRGPIVFQSPDGMIYSISAKITNVCSAADDVLALTDPIQNDILSLDSGYRYVRDGTLDHAKAEVSEERTDPNRVCVINRISASIIPEYKTPEKLTRSNREQGMFRSSFDSQQSPLPFSTRRANAASPHTRSRVRLFDTHSTPTDDCDSVSLDCLGTHTDSEDTNLTPKKRAENHADPDDNPTTPKHQKGSPIRSLNFD